MEYIALKLATGQEVIGKINLNYHPFDIDQSYIVEDPFEVKSQWAANGEFQMGLVPFIPYAKDNKVVFHWSALVATSVPADALIKEYTKNTSGILIP